MSGAVQVQSPPPAVPSAPERRRELLDAVVAVVRRDALMFWSYRLRVFSQSAALFFSMTLFFYVSKLVNVTAFPTPGRYFAYVAVGLVILTVLTATLTAVPLAVRQELMAGTFERFVISPTGPTLGVTSMLLFPMVSALGLSVFQLMLAGVIYGLEIEWTTAPLAVPVAFLGALSFMPFALLMASAVVVMKQVSGGVTFVTTGLAFLGGFFFPVTLLPGWLEWTSKVQPFTPALDLLRHLLVGTDLVAPAWQSLLKISLFAAILIPAAAWVLSRAVHKCRVRGTLIEY